MLAQLSPVPITLPVSAVLTSTLLCAYDLGVHRGDIKAGAVEYSPYLYPAERGLLGRRQWGMPH